MKYDKKLDEIIEPLVWRMQDGDLPPPAPKTEVVQVVESDEGTLGCWGKFIDDLSKSTGMPVKYLLGRAEEELTPEDLEGLKNLYKLAEEDFVVNVLGNGGN